MSADMKRIQTIFILLSLCICASAADFSPNATYLYAQTDQGDLYLDIYEPAEDTGKPTVIYAAGGGFINAKRNNKSDLPFFKALTDAGFRVISIDYRQGLKGVKKKNLMEFVQKVSDAIKMATEDMISATQFLINNEGLLKIDPNNLVLCGSSAGAIMSLQSEWEVCNGTSLSKVLPSNFNYKGVVAFAGAILSDTGGIDYEKMAPCPTLMFHGTSDRLVSYNRLKLLKRCFAGSDCIAKTFEKEGYTYSIYRYKGRGHEIAASAAVNAPIVIGYLNSTVIGGNRRNIDAMIKKDPAIPSFEWGNAKPDDLY